MRCSSATSRHGWARRPGALPPTRRLPPPAPILARAPGRAEADELRRSGATDVIQPEVEASAALIRHAFGRLALPAEQAAAYLDRFRDAIETAEARPPGAPAPFPEVREVPVPAGRIADQSLR